MTNDEENALGQLAELAVRQGLGPNEYFARMAMSALRGMWPKVVPYFRRHIVCAIEVGVALADTRPIALIDDWRRFVAEMRDPRSPFTVNYRCGKCKSTDVKLWRGVHGCADKDGNELLCARCLAPNVEVDASGKAPSDYGRSDQVGGWLPAVPVDDTFWGYSSVPSQDLEWWLTLPTYPPAVLTGGAE